MLSILTLGKMTISTITLTINNVITRDITTLGKMTFCIMTHYVRTLNITMPSIMTLGIFNIMTLTLYAARDTQYNNNQLRTTQHKGTQSNDSWLHLAKLESAK